MTVTMESAVFMGKNFQNNQNSIVNAADLTLKQNVRHIHEIGGLNKMRSQDWKQLGGRIIHGNTCHSLVTKEYQSSAHEGLCLFGVCVVVPWEDFRKS